MRISIDAADPGYLPQLLGSHPRPQVTIYVDGVPQDGVVTADNEAGLVIAYVRDGDGGWKHAAGQLLRGEIRGEVRIEGLT